MGWPSLRSCSCRRCWSIFILGRPVGARISRAARASTSRAGSRSLGSLIALWLALSLYTGAFIAENVRAGILAVSKGQTEAAAALGLRPRRIMNLVVLPQALRVIIPPLISQYLNLTKNSSLAIAVGYMDITGTLGGITLNQTGRAIECVLLLMLFYLAISPGDLGDDEHLQQLRQAEGALRCPTHTQQSVAFVRDTAMLPETAAAHGRDRGRSNGCAANLFSSVGQRVPDARGALSRST